MAESTPSAGLDLELPTEASPETPQTSAPVNPFAGSDEAPLVQQGHSSDDGAYSEFGFDDDSVKQFEFDLYKGRKGQTDRLGFLTPTITGARVHFKTGVGYFVCHSSYRRVKLPDGSSQEIIDRLAPCCKGDSSPRKRFIAPIIKYSTFPDGRLTPDLVFQLMVWRFTDDKYVQLRTMNEQFPLANHDVMITCTEENWQKLTIQPCAKSLWRDPKWPADQRKTIEEWASMVKPKLGRSLGRKFTETELLERLGLAPTPQLVADAPMMNINELLKD